MVREHANAGHGPPARSRAKEHRAHTAAQGRCELPARRDGGRVVGPGAVGHASFASGRSLRQGSVA